MIGALLRKDWVLLWPMAVLVVAIQLCWEWSRYNYGLFGGVGDIDRLLSVLSGAWLCATAAVAAAVVLADVPPSTDQDWLIRPIRRTDLLLSKLLFVALVIAVPSIFLDAGRAVVTGFAPWTALGSALLKAVLLYVYLLVPIMALTSTVARMTDLLILGAAMIVVYGIVRSAASALLGIHACPTCGTGLAWLQHLWQHLEILLGSIVVLIIQYYRRVSAGSRVIVLGGVVLIVVAQLPWNAAFAVQQRLTRSLAVGQSAVQESVEGIRNAMVANLGASAAAIPLELSLRVTGLSSNEVLYVDRSEILTLDSAGRTYSRELNIGTLAISGPAQPETANTATTAVRALQGWSASSAVYRAMSRHPAQLQHWLTLMQAVRHVSLPALDAAVRSSYAGHCASRLNPEATAINVRCSRLGPAPVCVRATLHGAKAQQDPSVLSCQADYRPYLPVLDIFSTFGIDVPLRDSAGVGQYSIDLAAIEHATLDIDFYEAGAHFLRRAEIPASADLKEANAAQ